MFPIWDHISIATNTNYVTICTVLCERNGKSYCWQQCDLNVCICGHVLPLVILPSFFFLFGINLYYMRINSCNMWHHFSAIWFILEVELCEKLDKRKKKWKCHGDILVSLKCDLFGGGNISFIFYSIYVNYMHIHARMLDEIIFERNCHLIYTFPLVRPWVRLMTFTIYNSKP